MSTTETTTPVRICKIAGRYLVFDSNAVAFLRRNASLSATFVGTTPQQPSQNTFLGLPVELRPEEAEALVRKELAFVVDDVAAHQAVLRNPDSEARRAYLDSLRTKKQTAHRVLAENNAKKAAEMAERHSQARRNAQPRQYDSAVPSTSSDAPQPDAPVKSLGVTPTSSGPLISSDAERAYRAERPRDGPLCRKFLNNGYYMTPGLRFGSQYSVYPGDPLRFHAHFMATQYGWNEEIPILDIVTGGRLATAVKKAFLIGGQEETDTPGDANVRTFTIEWAAM